MTFYIFLYSNCHFITINGTRNCRYPDHTVEKNTMKGWEITNVAFLNISGKPHVLVDITAEQNLNPHKRYHWKKIYRSICLQTLNLELNLFSASGTHIHETIRNRDKLTAIITYTYMYVPARPNELINRKITRKLLVGSDFMNIQN